MIKFIIISIFQLPVNLTFKILIKMTKITKLCNISNFLFRILKMNIFNNHVSIRGKNIQVVSDTNILGFKRKRHSFHSTKMI